MAGTIIADTLTHSTAGSVTTDYVVNGSAKAWVNFNGTGTVAVRSSLNTSGITDVSQGNYTLNISSAFNDADYAPSGNSATSSAGAGSRHIMFGSNYDIDTLDPNFTTTSFSVNNFYSNTDGTEYDAEYITISVHGDLA
jgi:hypothetical protein